MKKKNTKKKTIERIAAVLLTPVVCLFVFMVVRIIVSNLMPITYDEADCVQKLSYEPADWMAGIEDDLRLTEFTIPGTHDSSTGHIIFPYSYACQDTEITDQLEAGFRFLDLRCEKTAKEGDAEFIMHHSKGKCKKDGGLFAETLTLRDIFNDLYAFLEEHPTECVILLLTSDDDSALADYIGTDIASHGSYWYTENDLPTMGEARGKIITMTRGNTSATSYGLGVSYAAWEEDGPYVSGTISCGGNLFYQDLYLLGTKDKWAAFEALMDACPAGRDTVCINYLSCASGFLKLPSPKENARKLNRKLMKKDLADGNYGIVLVDFGTEELAEKLYETNFAD